MEKIYFSNDKSEEIYELFLKKKYKVLKTLKNDNRSKVLLIEILNRKLVLKIPIEKNTKKWQRFISIFRGSESRREYFNCLKIHESGFLGLTPVLFYEKKECLMVKDSFLITEYLEGKIGSIENLEEISKELNKIHNSGFLHGDSQLPNFIIKNDKVYIIDAKFQTNIYGSIGASYEFIYLEESCHKNIDIYNKITTSYKIAKFLNDYLHWFGRMKKKLRGKE